MAASCCAPQCMATQPLFPRLPLRACPARPALHHTRQTFFSSHNPVFAKGLSPLMRWMYGEGPRRRPPGLPAFLLRAGSCKARLPLPLPLPRTLHHACTASRTPVEVAER